MISRYCILTVEDDPAIRSGLVDALRMSGYEVIEAGDSDTASSIIQSREFDLALLDIVLPGKAGNGLDLLRQIRQIRSTLPVIMLTAKGSESHRVEGLRLGADDYVVKPFSLREVLARIEAVLRRSPERPQSLTRLLLPCGFVDLTKREIRFPDGASESLTSREFELLRHLASHSDRTISREEILTRVWKMDPRLVETRSIDVTLARLREKLGKANAGKIRTIRGQGYLFDSSSTPTEP